MFELERFDRETRIPVEPPFYLLQDGSMINSNVFRSPADYQYAVIGSENFLRCKIKLITLEKIWQDGLTAQLNPFPNEIEWHSQYVDSLWTVSEVRGFTDWYQKSRFIGYFEGGDVKESLPRTYQQFQGKRDELKRTQREFEKWISSLSPVDTEPTPF